MFNVVYDRNTPQLEFWPWTQDSKYPWRASFNPLSPNGDQHQFSPNDIHNLSRDQVMRINKMINNDKMPWSFIKFAQHILYGNV